MAALPTGCGDARGDLGPAPGRRRARLARCDTEPHRIAPLAPGPPRTAPGGSREPGGGPAGASRPGRRAGPRPGQRGVLGIFAGRLAGASRATGGTYASNRPVNLRVGARRRRSSLPLAQSADGRVENVPARGRLTWHQRPGRALDRQWPPASCGRVADGSGRREPGWHRGACPGPRPLALRAGPGPLRRAARPVQSEGVIAHIHNASGHPRVAHRPAASRRARRSQAGRDYPAPAPPSQARSGQAGVPARVPPGQAQPPGQAFLRRVRPSRRRARPRPGRPRRRRRRPR
jgi:hypothetical protein